MTQNLIFVLCLIMKKNRKYEFDASNFCCQNEKCKKYKKENTGDVKFLYFNGKQKKTAYLKCTVCGKVFSENKGTFFYRKKIDKWRGSQ